MIKVYIASPYTLGEDTAANVKLQIDTVDTLIGLGFCPFAPLMSHFQHMIHPRPYNDWMEQDFEWVKACDCLLRIGGDSPGGDKEAALAKSLGKPVLYSLTDLVKKYKRLETVE